MSNSPRVLALVLIGLLSFLAGCGMKGPLYLPAPAAKPDRAPDPATDLNKEAAPGSSR